MVKGPSLDIILGNDFLQRNKAVINFKEKVVELDGGDRSIRVNFEQVLDKIRVTGVKILQKRVGESDTEARVNSCIEGEYIESFERERGDISEEMWEIRADEFCSGGEVVRLSLIHI